MIPALCSTVSVFAQRLHQLWIGVTGVDDVIRILLAAQSRVVDFTDTRLDPALHVFAVFARFIRFFAYSPRQRRSRFHVIPQSGIERPRTGTSAART